MMFGYATAETEELMPLPISLAHRLAHRLAVVRKDGTLPYLRPDAKTQVTVRYRDNVPVEIERVLISTQHADGVDRDSTIRPDLIEQVIKPVLPAELCDSDRIAETMLVNPTGRFVVGGPVGDAGLTGRKIIVDTYGGMARHGGGAFSGKDPSKVDRSAAYAARHVAKNVVAAGLAERCEVQVAYAIGVAHPVSLMVETFGTGKLSDAEISRLVEAEFDLRPGAFRRYLDLHRPIYRKTAAYGHFGRSDEDFTWERTDRADALRDAAGAPRRPRLAPLRGDLEAHARVAEAVELGGAECGRRGEEAAALRGRALLGQEQAGLAEHLRRRQVARVPVRVDVDADVVAADGSRVDHHPPGEVLHQLALRAEAGAWKAFAQESGRPLPELWIASSPAP